MSVRQGERGQGKLEVLDSARRLVEYTMTVCDNTDVIPKKHRWTIGNRLVDECLGALTDIRKANAVRLEAQYANRRRNYQISALEHLEAMYALVDTAFNMFKFAANRLEHWTRLVSDTEIKIRAWVKSDKARLG